MLPSVFPILHKIRDFKGRFNRSVGGDRKRQNKKNEVNDGRKFLKYEFNYFDDLLHRRVVPPQG